MKRDLSFGSVIDVIKRYALANAAFLILMSVFRIVFFLYFGGLRTLPGLWEDVLKAFFLGFRFDLGVDAYVNIPVTLSLITVSIIKSKGLFRIWFEAVKYYYTLMFSFVFIVLCIDFGFYSYFKNHINIIIFGIFEDDTSALFSTLTENYNVPLVALGFLALIACAFLIIHHFTKNTDLSKEYNRKYPLAIKAVLLSGVLIVNAAAARGSFGLFPLGTMDAEISSDIFINKVSINGIYTLQEALEARMNENDNDNIARQVGYENAAEKAFSDLLGLPVESLNRQQLQLNIVKKTKNNNLIEQIKPNVVLIMMEGFGSDLLNYDTGTFNVAGELKKHLDADTLFTNFLSGDVGTIGSIETVVLNMPKRPNSKAVTQSKYAYSTYFTGAAVPYKRSGYETVFIYGGNAGWRNVFLFAGNLGFDTTEGAGSMKKEYLRNQWGVYDEFLFEHIYEKLAAESGKPKFIFAMTTSNHPPYSLPPDYKKLPLEIPSSMKDKITGDRELALKRFETYQYANQKLGELITKIKASPLGKNTIVAVTGDHNFWSVFDYPKERYLDLDGVPFYLYVPKAIKPEPVKSDTFGSHADIMPTLYNLSLSGQEYAALGADMLDNTVEHIAYNADGLVMSEKRALRCNIENNTVSYYEWDHSAKRLLKPAAQDEAHSKLLKRFKSAIAVTDYLIKNPLN